jgi:hypothetical protein
MGHELNFTMQERSMGGTFSVWLWEKNWTNLQGFQVWGGSESLVIGNWIEQ